MAYDAWLEVPGLAEEGRPIRLPVEIGERHSGVDTWLASLNLVMTVDDFIDAVEDPERLSVEQVTRMKRKAGRGHSTSKPHEYYGDQAIPGNLAGLLEEASHILPPDWEPKISWAEQNHIEGRVGFFPAPLADREVGIGVGDPYGLFRRRTQPLYMIEAEQRKRRRRRDPDDLDDLLNEFPDVEEEMDPTDPALEAETRNETAPRADQQLANMLIGNHVVVVTGPLVNVKGLVAVWERAFDGEIWLDLSQCDNFGKVIPSAPMRVRMTDVERFVVDKLELEDPGYLEDETAVTMTEAEQDAAIYDFRGDEDDGGWARRPEAQIISEVEAHGPAVSVTVTTPEGEPLGAWRTYEDGTHVPVGELACPECHIVHSAVRHCRNCNCIDAHACEGGCFWTDEDECSTCFPADVHEPEPIQYEPPAGYHDEIHDGPPAPDHVNPPVEKTPEEVAAQKEKGTRKLIKESEDLERWKKTDLPYLVDQVKKGYDPNTARVFQSMTDDQSEVFWESLYKKKLATHD